MRRLGINTNTGSLENKTSFYYPLLLLPHDEREGMEVLYRYCREADDIADGEGTPLEKKSRFSRFLLGFKAALRDRAQEPLFQNLQNVIHRFTLTPEPLHRILKGVKRDLGPVRFKTFTQLHQYALEVAGGPGLSSMEIFGYKDAEHRQYAENLGVFLQIVNIVRDYIEDGAMGRQYLPTEDFRHFQLEPRFLDETSRHWRSFVEFQLDRAWYFLEKSRESLTLSQRAKLPTAESIAEVYVKLYDKLWLDPYRILEGKAGLSKADKILSVAGATGRCLVWRWAKD